MTLGRVPKVQPDPEIWVQRIELKGLKYDLIVAESLASGAWRTWMWIGVQRVALPGVFSSKTEAQEQLHSRVYRDAGDPAHVCEALCTSWFHSNAGVQRGAAP